MDSVSICGYVPGAIGTVTALHAAYYSENWGLDVGFEAEVATELGEFMAQFDPARDGFWVALLDGNIGGSITIDGRGPESGGARLRWFILADDIRGRGIGRRLMEQAVGFCREKGTRRIVLWTFSGLVAARRLYDDFGFSVSEEKTDNDWGRTVIHQRTELNL